MTFDQLKAINRMLSLPTIGSKTYLRFQLNMKLRQLRADDVVRMVWMMGIAGCSNILWQGAVTVTAVRPKKRLPFEVKCYCRMFKFECLNSLMSLGMH